ncbi:hypothetical protein HNQ80_003248 [Anaerosolibacter carboniphilus]|uniref:Uncharacterized protein n=1 Tax=Anaerosolibacter carboniphilus TaxID=1417629 RepID=A0A841L1U9_9FIRM|nr:hypothetical protein [Anaerosolibacter carboniphilus]MBB6217142.1 hypothetical protein [Anaerosolibacter carboniphilus]
MKILKGEMMEESNIVGIFNMPFHDKKSFFYALVTLCDRFKIDIPIWTFREDKLMAEKGEITIPLEEQRRLRLIISEEG